MRLETFRKTSERSEESKELQHMTQSYEALQQFEEVTSSGGTLDDPLAKGPKFADDGTSIKKNGVGNNGNGYPHKTYVTEQPLRALSDDSDDLFPFGDGLPKKNKFNSINGTSSRNGRLRPTPVAKQKTKNRVVPSNGDNSFKSHLHNTSVAQLLKGEAQPWKAAKEVARESKDAKREPAVQESGTDVHLLTEPVANKSRDTKLKGLVFATEPSADSLHQNHDHLVTASPYKSIWLEIPEGSPIFPFDGNEPRVAEQYRILRTSILLNPTKPHVMAVSSGSSGDGKTLTAINIAGILAMKSETKVLIVEGDLRKCALAPILGIKSSPGLAEVLRGKASLDDAIVRAEQLPNFHVLPAGTVTDNPAELLDSDEFRNFVKEVRKRFSFVVFDTTPAASVADFKLVMQVSDGVLMVVRPDHTDRDSFQRAFELVPEKLLLGAVINAFEDWFLWKQLDANYYYSGEVRKAKAKPFFNWRRRSSVK